MRLYFIRHAQSANNALFDTTGSEHGRSDDPELSEAGLEQAALLAAFLARSDDALEPGGVGFTHLYASPMVRAAHTASFVAQALGLKLALWDDWHETGGIWLENEFGERVGRPGKTRAELQARFPGVRLPEHHGDAGWWNRPHEADCRERAGRVWRELLERHGGTGDRVAVVSHGHFYVYVMACALNLPVGPGMAWLMKHNTGVTRLDVHEDEYESTMLVYQNRLAHLPSALVT